MTRGSVPTEKVDAVKQGDSVRQRETQAAGESRRLARLADLQLMGSEAEERFDRVTRLARELFDVPDAMINLIGEAEQFTKSPQQPGRDPFRARAEAFCDVTIDSSDILVVEDATQDERFAHRTPVTGPEHVRFYAGRPLDVGEGLRVGVLCLVDTVPRSLTPFQVELLDQLGAWVERELRADADRLVAASIQQSLLPTDKPLWPDYDISAQCAPARTLAGDFYDWCVHGDYFSFTVADVMGKGDGSALLAALVRATLATLADEEPAAAVRQLNSALHRDFDPNASFATLVHARMHAPSGELRVADAGHGLTLLVRADGTRERLASACLPIGILPDGTWDEHNTVICPGDTLVSVTDGALEMFDGTLDSLDTIAGMVLDAPDSSTAVERVLSCLPESAPDDVTVLVLRRVARDT